jgi:hypothetical protein
MSEMKCNEVRLTKICKSCGVSNTDAVCPTAGNEGSKTTYAIPPSTIFDLVPYKNEVGERVICVDAHGSSEVKVGEIFTVIGQTNKHFGYIRLDKFKDYPNMWFGPDSFKKLNVTYNGIEYTLRHGVYARIDDFVRLFDPLNDWNDLWDHVIPRLPHKIEILNDKFSIEHKLGWEIQDGPLTDLPLAVLELVKQIQEAK